MKRFKEHLENIISSGCLLLGISRNKANNLDEFRLESEKLNETND